MKTLLSLVVIAITAIPSYAHHGLNLGLGFGGNCGVHHTSLIYAAPIVQLIAPVQTQFIQQTQFVAPQTQYREIIREAIPTTQVREVIREAIPTTQVREVIREAIPTTQIVEQATQNLYSASVNTCNTLGIAIRNRGIYNNTFINRGAFFGHGIGVGINNGIFGDVNLNISHGGIFNHGFSNFNVNRNNVNIRIRSRTF